MLPTIVFGVALLCSGLYITLYLDIFINATMNKVIARGEAYIFLTIAIIMWTWLYYLSH